MPSKCKNNPRRSAHTREQFGQKTKFRPVPPVILCRAWLPDGNLLGVAQNNDRFVVATFTATEKPVGTPIVFSGGGGRSAARRYASRLLGRKVIAF